MMKHLLTLLFIAATFSYVTAQSFSDDFESYDVGSYVGNNADEWTTWSGATGGAEDAQVVDDKANSGSKSIYFYSTGQGPQDVVLDFGAKYTTGVFDMTFSIFVTENTSAYWNFQQEEMIGVTWAGNAWYRNDDRLTVDAGAEVLFTPFEAGAWNKVEYNIDLDNNEWIIKINDVCVGTLLAPAAVASLDIFPLTDNATTSEFWIDDVSFNYTETMIEKELDVVLTDVASVGPAFVGNTADLGVTVVNTGTVTVEDLELSLDIDGTASNESYSDLALAPGESVDLSFPGALDVKQGVNVVAMGVSSINGLGSDDSPCNNNVVTGVTGIKLAEDKRVVAEEGTGTWCPWCPRGTVYMGLMKEKYDDRFIGIAVHNGDPMTVTEYDNYVGAFPGFTGYPGVIVDRISVVDPSGMESPMISRLQLDVNSTFGIQATYDEELKELVATVTVNAKNDLPSNRRLVVVLVEDDVTGTGAAYAQANAYAGGGNGPMGGYEDLPSPVPASQMVYDDVARALFTPANGMALGEEITAGSSKDFTFGTVLSDEIETEHLRIVAFLALPSPVRSIDNAYEVSFEEAILANNKEFDIDIAVDVFPNPTGDITNIALDLGNSANVDIQLVTMTGQLVSSRNYGKLSGNQIFTIDASNLSNGMYNAIISIDGKKVNKRIVVSH